MRVFRLAHARGGGASGDIAGQAPHNIRRVRPQAHVAASLAVWALGPRAPWEAPLLAVAGNLPDFDRNVAKALGVRRRDHHRWVSHSLAGWGPATVLALRWSAERPWRGTVRRSVAALWLHLAMDTYADGLAWLWPLHRDKIGLFRKPPEIRDDGWRTPAPWHTNMGRIEAAIWAVVVGGLLSGRRVG